MTDDVPSEEEIIEKEILVPGPYYSKDIEKWHFAERLDVICGHDRKVNCIQELAQMLKNGYYIMVESCINFDHWTVLLGFIQKDSDDKEDYMTLLYDPYYNEVKMMRADELDSMWNSGLYADNHVIRDYVALKWI